MTASTASRITGAVLAGGRARRMGGVNKALVVHDGRPLYQYAVENLSDWCCDVLINTHRDADVFTSAGFSVVSDGAYADCGPLAGIYASLKAATTSFVAIAACDQLKLPSEIYETLCLRATGERGAYARSNVDDIPTCAVLPVGLAPEILDRLRRQSFALMPFMRAFAEPVTFSDTEFGNINFRSQVDRL